MPVICDRLENIRGAGRSSCEWCVLSGARSREGWGGDGEGMGRGGLSTPPASALLANESSSHCPTCITQGFFVFQTSENRAVADVRHNHFGKRLMDEDIAEQSGGDNGAVAEWSSEQKLIKLG